MFLVFFLSVDSFHVSTPLYVPSWCSLSLCPPSSLLLSFFCCQTLFFKKKKLFSPCYCCKTFVLLFSLLYHFLFSSLSVKPLQLFFSFFGFVFFLCCIFQSCSFEKKNSHQKNPFLTYPKLFFWISSRFKEKSSKIVPSTFIFWFFWTFEKMYFSLVCFEKHPFLFWWKMGKTKTQVFPNLLVGILPCFQKNLSLFFFKKNSWIETQKRVNREGKEVKPKREELKKRGQESSKNEYIYIYIHKYVSCCECMRWDDTYTHVFCARRKGCRIRVTHVHACSDCVYTRNDTVRLDYAYRFVRVIYSSHIVSIKLDTVTPLRRCGLAVHER